MYNVISCTVYLRPSRPVDQIKSAFPHVSEISGIEPSEKTTFANNIKTIGAKAPKPTRRTYETRSGCPRNVLVSIRKNVFVRGVCLTGVGAIYRVGRSAIGWNDGESDDENNNKLLSIEQCVYAFVWCAARVGIYAQIAYTPKRP